MQRHVVTTETRRDVTMTRYDTLEESSNNVDDDGISDDVHMYFSG